MEKSFKYLKPNGRPSFGLGVYSGLLRHAENFRNPPVTNVHHEDTFSDVHFMLKITQRVYRL